MNPLERKPDALIGHVRFDERGVETECMAGYSGTDNRKGRSPLRPCLNTTAPLLDSTTSEGSCFRGNGPMARREEGAYPQGSVTDEQRSQRAVSAKTLRAAGLLPVACVGSAVAARRGDAPASPPWPPPKSLTAEPL